MKTEPKVLFLSLTNSSSGNCTTAKRICNYLRQEKAKVHLVGLMSDNVPFHSKESFLAYIHQEGFHLVFGLHALHSGKWLQYLDDVPFVIIFGGTDLNQYSTTADSLKTMTTAVSMARHYVAFSKQMKRKAKQLWPDHVTDMKVEIISQAPITYPISSNLDDLLANKIASWSCDTKAVLWVGGLRPVKDVLFICQEFSNWYQSNCPHAVLLIVGPSLESTYAADCLTTISSLLGVTYMGELPMGETHALMRRSFALVNTSISEGMCTAILEAMQLELPVVVRRNHGNESIVTHGENGLLFDTPEESISCFSKLLDDPQLYENIKKTGLQDIRSHHSCETEKLLYANLVESVVRTNLSKSDTFTPPRKRKCSQDGPGCFEPTKQLHVSVSSTL